jgi:hypothetical protein
MSADKKTGKVLVNQKMAKGHQADSNIQTSPPQTGSALIPSNQGSSASQGSGTSKKQSKKI